MNRIPVTILGAGPAGLGAALQLSRRAPFAVTVLERAGKVGGNAGSFELDGIHVDFGSHRLHPASSPRVLTEIQSLLGPDLLARPRHGRIRLRGRWLRFPLKPVDLLFGLPPSFAAGALVDALTKPLTRRSVDDETFATILERGLGRTICRDFYFPYARKIWGVDATFLDAEQARRRVSANSISKMLGKILRSTTGRKSKGQGMFYYPRRGFGQISIALMDAAIKAGADIRLNSDVRAVEREGNRVVGVRVADNGGERTIQSRHVLSTIPLPALLRSIVPAAPEEVLAEAGSLAYRAMLLIYLVLDTDRFTEFDAHYFPGEDIAITRLSEPKNYGLSGPAGTTVLCAELPCSELDQVWSESDSALADKVVSALRHAGLPINCAIRRVEVRRLRQAYPIYNRDYRRHFDAIDRWIGGLSGLTTFGRQGLFAHDNTHHTLAMAYAASDCLADDGVFDNAEWSHHRRAFESHVVED